MMQLDGTVLTPNNDICSSDDPLLDVWFELNYRLQEEACDSSINKFFLLRWMLRLWEIAPPRPQCFWLFLARLNELVLLCTAKYVDFCEFAAAEEFLIKPARFFTYTKLESSVTMATDKAVAALPFTSFTMDRESPGGLRREQIGIQGNHSSLVKILFELLEVSGYLTKDYLISVFRRTERIKKVAEMLSGLGMRNAEDFSAMFSCMNAVERRDLESRLCRFDRKIFDELGRSFHLFVRSIGEKKEYTIKYLVQ